MNCRTCKSYPNCYGCNVDTLIKALENGKFDFDEHHNVIIPDKVVHARWESKLADDGWKDVSCSNCNFTIHTDVHCSVNDNYCLYCGAKMNKE